MQTTPVPTIIRLHEFAPDAPPPDMHASEEISQQPDADTENPDVSFIVAACNVAPYVAEAVNSARTQRSVTAEIIVVDDCSDDETAEIVAQLAAVDPRVRLIRMPVRSGPSAVRNTAFAAARGDWLAILDADDFIDPERTRMLLDLALATSADIVADNYARVDVHGRDLGATMIPAGRTPHAMQIDLADFMDGNIAFAKSRFTLGAIKPVLSRAFVAKHGLSYRTDLECGEDYDLLYACLAEGGRFVVTSQVGYRYRMRQGSLSWRINADHVTRLLQAHRALRVNERFAQAPRILAAAHRYETALTNADQFLAVVGDAKAGRLPKALSRSLSSPRIWPLLLRFGAEAAGRRLGVVR